MSVSKVYRVFERSCGSLIEPRNHWTEGRLFDFFYETEEDAIKDIDLHGEPYATYIFLPVYRKEHDATKQQSSNNHRGSLRN